MLPRTLYNVMLFDREGKRIRSVRIRALKAELEVELRIIRKESVTVEFHASGKQLEDRRARFKANLQQRIRGLVVSADIADSSRTAYTIKTAEE